MKVAGQKPSRIPVRIEMRAMQPAPAPVGKPVPTPKAPPREHWSQTFADVIDHHLWRKHALDAFESHAFTGAPGAPRWCSRCTLQLPADWKDPKKPVPLMCGDARIVPRMAVYAYTYDGDYTGIVPADPNYMGAKIKEG